MWGAQNGLGGLTQLSEQVNKNKDRSQEGAAAPGHADVVPLLVPLQPHPQAVLQEGADQTQMRQVRQIALRDAEELQVQDG